MVEYQTFTIEHNKVAARLNEEARQGWRFVFMVPTHSRLRLGIPWMVDADRALRDAS